MNLTKEQKQAVNIAVAKDMGFKILFTEPVQDDGMIVVEADDKEYFLTIFDPDNTTDLNKAVEFYKMKVNWQSGYWLCDNGHAKTRFSFNVSSESRDESMRMAVTKASGVEV